MKFFSARRKIAFLIILQTIFLMKATTLNKQMKGYCRLSFVCYLKYILNKTKTSILEIISNQWYMNTKLVT